MVNFPPRQIGPFISEVLTLGMPDDEGAVVLVKPDFVRAEWRQAVLMAAHYYAVSWDQLHRDARALAWRLMDKGPFAGIVAITRGGLIPAAIIARELDVRLVESVSILSYAAGSRGTLIEEESKGAPVVIKPPAAAGEGAGFLIVDDLVDTGTTARVVRGLLPQGQGALATACSTPARGAAGGGRLHHRGVAGHLDPVSVGYRTAVRRTAGEARQLIARILSAKDAGCHGPRLSL